MSVHPIMKAGWIVVNLNRPRREANNFGDIGPTPRPPGIELEGEHHPRGVVALANELLALWDRPLITRTTIEGSLRPS